MILKQNRIRGVLFFLFFILISCGVTQKTGDTRTFKINTLAFYNVENLFDPVDNPDKYDESSPIMHLPKSKRKQVYHKKLNHTAKVIYDIGRNVTGQPPAIIGLCEAENRRVLRDLIETKKLRPYDYKIVHYESPDERGIDVALLYREKIFHPLSHSSHELILYEKDEPNNRDYTRDQLLVSGLLDGDKIHIIINHWPSRSGGVQASKPYRMKAARLNKSIIDSIRAINPYAKIITMGDFNDNPFNASLKQVLNTKSNLGDIGLNELYNPMEKMLKRGIGSSAYHDQWDLFDQIILSGALLNKANPGYHFYKAGVFNPNYLITQHGEYEGYPYRSFSWNHYIGGYSDHFPVYVYLIKRVLGSKNIK